MWIIQIWKETLQSVIYGMTDEEKLNKRVYSSLFYVMPILNYEGLNLAHLWICRKLTIISQNWMWIIQIWKETLQSFIYGMKEEKVLSKTVYKYLLYILPLLNNEGLKFGRFWGREKWTNISQNWTRITQVWKDSLQSFLYVMKEEKMLSNFLQTLLYMVLILNNEGL